MPEGDPPRRSASWRRETGTVHPRDLRVSDAERREVADELSRHFGDGRLDQEEFDERMAKAMGAKTRFELYPLLADFPVDQDSGHDDGRPPRFLAHVVRAAAGLLLLALVVATLWHAVVFRGLFFRANGGLFLLVILGFLFVRRSRLPRGSRRFWHLD